MKYCLFAAAITIQAATPCLAFVSNPPSFIRTNDITQGKASSSHLDAYTDGENNIPSGFTIDKSGQSNVCKQKLPPSSLPNGGKITMVGSGPGDPDLLTMAAFKILSDPDAMVISDRLVSKEILDLIQGDYKIARKLPGCADAAQEEVRVQNARFQ